MLDLDGRKLGSHICLATALAWLPACAGSQTQSRLQPEGGNGILETITVLGLDTLCVGACSAIVIDSLVRIPRALTAAHPHNAEVAFVISDRDLAGLRAKATIRRGRYQFPYATRDTVFLAFQINASDVVVPGADREFAVTVFIPPQYHELLLVALKSRSAGGWSVYDVRRLLE